MKAAITMLLYAAALLAVGWLTYAVAPPGANAKTALFISGAIAGLMVFCAIATMAIKKNRVLGMAGIHLGLVIPLLGAIGPLARISGSYAGAQEFNNAVEAGGVVVGATGDADATAPEPVAYQTVGLGATAALSLFAFGAILLHRPKPAREPGVPLAPTEKIEV
ncbi:MAG: hypothetical protein ACTS3F_14130 [Phycisphaerales bacterium]